MRRLLAIFALWPMVALGAIALDTSTGLPASCASNDGNATCTTGSFSALEGTRLYACLGNNSTATPAPVNANGLTWTQVDVAANSPQNYRVSVYEAVVPAGGVSGITVQGSGYAAWVTRAIGVAGLTGTSGTGAHTNVVSPGAPGTAVSGSLTTTGSSGSWIIACGMPNSATGPTYDANTAGIVTLTTGTTTPWLARKTAAVAAGTYAVGTTAPLSASGNWVLVLAEAQEGGAPPPSGPVHSGMAGFWGMLLLPSGGEQYE